MPQPLLTPGMLVGETWEILSPIGRGGMGEVWLARHVRVEGKQAAIKVLRATTDGMPDQVARFAREAEIAARLEHPNIVHLFDFASLPSGAPYLVMELLRGESLGKRLERGPIPLVELQQLVVQIGSALHVAHAAGVVHRDLKPENIFLVATPTGTQVKVLDFGISKLIGSDSLQTSDSIVLGTPQYMSPEQAMAEHQTITGQSDLFSLGTICFEALTGHRPFAAGTLARTVFLVAMEPSPSLGAYAPELPENVIAAIARVLAKHPEERTPDIATFVHEFCGVTISPAGARPSASSLPASSTPTPLFSRPKNPNAETVSSRQPSPPARGSRVVPFAVLAAALGIVVMVVVANAGQPPAILEKRAVAPVVPLPPPPLAVVVEEVDAGMLVVAVDAGMPRPLNRAPPLNAEQLLLIQSARDAVSRGGWKEVIEWSLKPAIAERQEAITLRVLAWCHLGNLGLVNAYKARVSPAERSTVVSACHAQGIDL